MTNEFIETGKIINTHGIRGEVKIDPWANSPQSLLSYSAFYIDGAEYPVISSRVHKRFVIAALKGIGSIDQAEALKDKIISIRREDIELSEGEYLLSDLIGLQAVDDETGNALGRVTDILTLPGGDVCEIRGEREILIPIRPEFVIDTDIAGGKVRFRLIEGM
ncbi:MAG: ribosome maturation factor RimM [Oscillospiraceae bacterium]